MSPNATVSPNAASSTVTFAPYTSCVSGGYQTLGKPRAKHAGRDHQHVVAALNEVRGGHVPRQGAGAGDDDGLRGGRQEDAAQQLEGRREGGHEGRVHVAGGRRCAGRQHRRVHLDGPGDHAQRVHFR